MAKTNEVAPPLESPMENLVALKLATLAFELQTTAIRLEAQNEAPIEVALELYDITKRLREIALDVESYRKREKE